ncbi:MAG: class I SAM-dependent methyltransferase [Gammaproteobacteria bacterium]|nr:class I SAM-dependent methyltransferase [Gammaproteobacteria bacterium]
MSTDDNQPDWGTLAEKFDLWTPHIAPVGDALLAALDVQSGEHILDLASGTGEPALTLAKRQPLVKIIGTDVADGMVQVATRKAREQQLKNLSFQIMAAEALSFPDDHFDRLSCRFGVMLFADPAVGLQQMVRVLKPGGRCVLAVWDTLEGMTSVHWMQQVFKNRIPESEQPAVDKIVSMSGGVLEKLLAQAGFVGIETQVNRFEYQFSDFDAYWQNCVDSAIMKQQLDVLKAEQFDEVRSAFAELAAPYQTTDGLVIPHEYRLAIAIK